MSQVYLLRLGEFAHTRFRNFGGLERMPGRQIPYHVLIQNGP
jgi:hypothetical protein